MTPVAPQEIVSAHSPDSDDAFMFYALATKKVRSPRVTFRHVLSDIETLNRKAMEGFYDLSAISYHAYPYVADKYVLMASGSSHRRWLRPHDHRQPPHGTGGTQRQAHRYPRHHDHGVPGLQTLPAGFRARRHALRQNHRRHQGTYRGRRPDHPRSAIDVRPRRLPPHRRSRPLVQDPHTICRCRSAAMCCCVRSTPTSKANAAA